jgi:hypothetical protein
VRELLSDKFDSDRLEELAALMTEGNWTHDHPITVEDLRSVDYPVSCDLPASIFDLMALYPQPVKQFRSMRPRGSSIAFRWIPLICQSFSMMIATTFQRLRGS